LNQIFGEGEVVCASPSLLQRGELSDITPLVLGRYAFDGMIKRVQKSIKGVFLTGIAAVIPLGVTIYILYLIIGMMNKLVKIVPARFHPDQFLPFHLPGLGVIITLILIFTIGLVTRSYLGKKLGSFGERLVRQIPLVRGIYNALKQFVDAVFSDRGQSFKKAVLIEYPRKGLYSIAFVTGVSRGEVQTKTSQRCVNVFIPTTPNPTSGFYIMVPEGDMIGLDMTVEEAFTLIISGGIVSPEDIQHIPEKGEIHADNI